MALAACPHAPALGWGEAWGSVEVGPPWPRMGDAGDPNGAGSGPIPTADLGALATPHVIASMVYLLGLVGVGAWKAAAVRGDASNFHVAGRRLSWPVLVGSMCATWIGNGSLLGSAGLAYRNGPAGIWPSTGSWLGILIVYRISRRIRNLGRVTVPDILEARYSRTAADLGVVATVIAYITIVSYQFKGGAKILAIVTEGAVPEEVWSLVTDSPNTKLTNTL